MKKITVRDIARGYDKHQPTVLEQLWLLVLALFLVVAMIGMASTVGGCATGPVEVESVSWAGEAAIEVTMKDGGSVRAAVVYFGVEEGGDTVHCPVLYLDIQAPPFDLLLYGVPPSLDEAPIAQLCYEKFGQFGITPRPSARVTE
jgi:hypothetical protein